MCDFTVITDGMSKSATECGFKVAIDRVVYISEAMLLCPTWHRYLIIDNKNKILDIVIP